MTTFPKIKQRANGAFYRSIYIELDDETYMALAHEKNTHGTTYAHVITAALRAYFDNQNHHDKEHNNEADTSN